MIPVEKLSTLSMVAGNEKRVRFVIDGGMLKEWVGIGWIDIRKATAADRKKYPEVRR